MDLLRINNFNYNVDRMIGDVKSLTDLYGSSLGDVLQTTALASDPIAGPLHGLTEVRVLQKEEECPDTEEIDYGRLRFVKECMKIEELLDRLELLRQGKFRTSKHEFLSNQSPGFSDMFNPSGHDPSQWAGRTFEVSGIGHQLEPGPLLHPTLPSFGNTYDALAWFFKIEPFRQACNVCRGQIQIFIPNYLVRIEEITKSDKTLSVTVRSKLPWNDIRYKVVASSWHRQEPHEISPDGSEARIELSLEPIQLSVWILSDKFGLMDFHLESEHGNDGRRPCLLPKRERGQVGAQVLPNEIGLERTRAEILVPGVIRQIWANRDVINKRMVEKFDTKLFQVHEERVFGDLPIECTNEEQFTSGAQTLACLVDWMNVSGLKSLVPEPAEPGSVNILSAFLAKEYPKADPRITSNFRRIMTIRKKYPTHRDTSEVVAALRSLVGSYPPKGWHVAWLKLLESYLEALTLIRDALLE